jgi:hypothetical protein
MEEVKGHGPQTATQQPGGSQQVPGKDGPAAGAKDDAKQAASAQTISNTKDVNSLSQTQAAGTVSGKKPSAVSARREMRKHRKSQLSGHEKDKPSEDTDDPRDVAAIIHVRFICLLVLRLLIFIFIYFIEFRLRRPWATIS